MAGRRTFSVLSKCTAGVPKHVQLPSCLARTCSYNSVRNRCGGASSNLVVGDILERWKRKFQNCGISEPKESAEYIVMHVMGYRKVSDLRKNQRAHLHSGAVQEVARLCARRLERMPVQYIIGEWDFRDLTLKMARPVFIPRPETEALVELVLEELDAQRAERVLELGCGSGAISLALLKARPKLKAVALDKSESACQLTLENARWYGLSGRLEVVLSEIANFRGARAFPVIVSNPPYVPAKDMHLLQPEIARYEDPDALLGGEDGLDVVRVVLAASAGCLQRGGKLFLEVDSSHPTLLARLLGENPGLGLALSRSVGDFAGKERFVEIIKEK